MLFREKNMEEVLGKKKAVSIWLAFTFSTFKLKKQSKEENSRKCSLLNWKIFKVDKILSKIRISVLLCVIMEIVDQKISHPGNTSEICGKSTLKQMYLLAYHFVLKALYLQGNINWKLATLLTDLREALHISNEEHANELRCIISGQYN